MASLHLSHLMSVRSLPLVALVLGLSQAAPVSAPVGSAQPSFDEYLKHFGKSYEATEYAERKALYEKRLIEIIKHNLQPGRLWNESVNKFTDARPRKPKLLSRHRPDASASNDTLSQHVAVPAMVDWRTHQPPVLTESRDQGDCGDCWAIAATKALESHLAIATGELLTLSTQAVADCASKGNRKHDCNFGGFAEDAFYHAKKHGVPLEQHYPRLNRGAACQRRAPPAAGAKGHRHLYNGAPAMMRTLASRGPITVGVDSSRWDPYQGGIFDGCSKSSTALDHEVLLVGYGQEHGVKFWIVQNSWGSDWGEEGFMRLRRYDNEPCMKDANDPKYTNCGECGVLAEGTFPIGAFRHSDRRLGAHDRDGIWV